MNKSIVFSIIFFLSLNSYGQITIFSETFNETSGSTSGNDNVGGVNWSSSCGGCISGDIWEVVGGSFQNNDSNGPAIISSSPIDVSSCTEVEICFDYSVSGTFEACGTGCNSVDWIYMTYSIGTGMGAGTPTNPSNSYYCSGSCADLNVIWDGGAMGTSSTYCTGNIPLAAGETELEIEIGCQTWAGTEFIEIDNIEVTCSVIVPISFQNFQAKYDEFSKNVSTKWSISTENKIDYFVIERSSDGVEWHEISSKIYTNEKSNYEFDDHFPLFGASYYRVKGITKIGDTNYSEIHFLSVENTVTAYPNPTKNFVNIKIENSTEFTGLINIFNSYGKKIHSQMLLNSSKELTINTSNWPLGIYYVLLENGQSVSFVKE